MRTLSRQEQMLLASTNGRTPMPTPINNMVTTAGTNSSSASGSSSSSLAPSTTPNSIVATIPPFSMSESELLRQYLPHSPSRPPPADHIVSADPITPSNVVKPAADGPPAVCSEDNVLRCKVCSAYASGFHYGIYACEGCKGFFRRSLQNKIEWRPCTRRQKCQIHWAKRTCCQECRWRKCIAVGMSKDPVPNVQIQMSNFRAILRNWMQSVD